MSVESPKVYRTNSLSDSTVFPQLHQAGSAIFCTIAHCVRRLAHQTERTDRQKEAGGQHNTWVTHDFRVEASERTLQVHHTHAHCTRALVDTAVDESLVHIGGLRLVDSTRALERVVAYRRQAQDPVSGFLHDNTYLNLVMMKSRAGNENEVVLKLDDQARTHQIDWTVA